MYFVRVIVLVRGSWYWVQFYTLHCVYNTRYQINDRFVLHFR